MSFGDCSFAGHIGIAQEMYKEYYITTPNMSSKEKAQLPSESGPCLVEKKGQRPKLKTTNQHPPHRPTLHD
jgi:hypothetical protein